MRKQCGECRGSGAMRYADWPEMSGPVTGVSADIAVTSHQRPCHSCAGAGVVESMDRVPVYQFGRKIGTVPHDFDPNSFVSRSVMYRPRRGDFQQIGYHFDASPSLGNGDLEAVTGFQFERD